MLAALALAQPGQAIAQQVTPDERVTRSVSIRAQPSTRSPRLGRLVPGEALPVVGEAPGWWRVRLPDGRFGYVTKSWTDVDGAVSPAVSAAVAAAAAYRIHVIDVGTGLAVFVEGPDFALLYDAGSNDDRAEGARNRVLAYLRFTRPRLRDIDHVVLSHAHQDHVGLMPDLFAAYRVRHVWDSGRMFGTCVYRDLLEAVAAEPGVAYHEVAAGEGTRLVRLPAGCRRLGRTLGLPRGAAIDQHPVRLGEGAQITFLHRDASGHADPNENSLVARLDLGPVRVLLTGDAEAGGRAAPEVPPEPGSAEATLLSCCRSALQSRVLFAGHHGSKTSSRRAFLDAVGATLFVISSGPMSYGGTSLPDPEVVEELSRRGEVWRTDANDGACAVSARKIGPDADGRAGGCDNIVITIQGEMVSAAYVRTHD